MFASLILDLLKKKILKHHNLKVSELFFSWHQNFWKKKKSDTIYRVKIRQKKPFPIRQLLSNDARSWVTFQDLVKAVGSISFRGLRQCLTKVVLDPFNVNIALTLNTFDHRVLAGCCKHVNDQRSYLFSSDVPQIVVEYFALTGKLKSIVMNSISKKEKSI